MRIRSSIVNGGDRTLKYIGIPSCGGDTFPGTYWEGGSFTITGPDGEYVWPRYGSARQKDIAARIESGQVYAGQLCVCDYFDFTQTETCHVTLCLDLRYRTSLRREKKLRVVSGKFPLTFTGDGAAEARQATKENGEEGNEENEDR